MNRYHLTNSLSMQKLNLENENDLWLMKRLQSDELICGDNGYLWKGTYYHTNTSYLQYDDVYDSPFSIYQYEDPIGYLEISKIYETSSVYLSYALLEEARGHGYMKTILAIVSNDILLDRLNHVSEVILMIDSKNIISQKVATHAGFICDFKEDKKKLTYYKKRTNYLHSFKLK